MSRKVTETANEAQQNNDPVAEPIDGAEENRDATQPGGGEATAQLQSEVDRLKAERDQLVDRLARLQAEFENPASAKRANARTSAISLSLVPWSNSCPSWTTFSWHSDHPAQ